MRPGRIQNREESDESSLHCAMKTSRTDLIYDSPSVSGGRRKQREVAFVPTRRAHAKDLKRNTKNNSNKQKDRECIAEGPERARLALGGVEACNVSKKWRLHLATNSSSPTPIHLTTPLFRDDCGFPWFLPGGGAGLFVGRDMASEIGVTRCFHVRATDRSLAGMHGSVQTFSCLDFAIYCYPSHRRRWTYERTQLRHTVQQERTFSVTGPFVYTAGCYL